MNGWLRKIALALTQQGRLSPTKQSLVTIAVRLKPGGSGVVGSTLPRVNRRNRSTRSSRRVRSF